jgi:deoxycytidine triphosphate deaminase
MTMINIGGSNAASSLTNVQEKDVQPNAVDLRVDKILKILSNDFTIDEDQKVHRGSEELEPDKDGYFHLEPGAYEVLMENIITIGHGEAGWVIPRSTLNRNGVFLTSGLYDSGYKGVMASVMHVTTGTMRIAKGTRIGQYLNFQAETLSMYDGDYGIGKEFDKKNYEGK